MTTLDPHRDTCPDCDCCTISLCATARLNRQPCRRYALVATTDAEQRVAACECAPVGQTNAAQERPRVVIPFTTGACFVTTLDPAYPNPEALAAEVEPWLQECGSCDAALPMACACPPGDYRVILLKVWQAYQAGRVLVAEEIAQAIEDLSHHDYRHDEFAVGVGAAAAKAREIGGAS